METQFAAHLPCFLKAGKGKREASEVPSLSRVRKGFPPQCPQPAWRGLVTRQRWVILRSKPSMLADRSSRDILRRTATVTGLVSLPSTSFGHQEQGSALHRHHIQSGPSYPASRPVTRPNNSPQQPKQLKPSRPLAPPLINPTPPELRKRRGLRGRSADDSPITTRLRLPCPTPATAWPASPAFGASPRDWPDR